MFKVRLILGALIAGLLGIGYVLYLQPAHLWFEKDGNGSLRGLALFIDGLLITSAAVTLLLASLRVQRTANGELVLGDNWFLRLNRRLWHGDDFPAISGNISLCKMYWAVVIQTLMGLLLAAFAATVLLMLCIAVYGLYQGGIAVFFTGILNVVTERPEPLIFGGLIFGIVWSVTHARKNNNKWYMRSVAWGLFISLLLYIELLVTSNQLTKGKSLVVALLIAPGYGLAFAAICAVGVALLYAFVTGIFQLSKELRDTAFGRMLMVAKNGLCPVFELPEEPKADQPAQNQPETS